MDKLIQALLSLGLTEKEAQVYLALYKIGEGTSYEVAKESGIKRPTVYVLMESLRKRGLALVVPHPKKQLFVAKNPKEFVSEYQNRFNRSAADLLSLLPKITRPDTDVLVFKGAGAIAQGLSYGIHDAKDKKVYAFYAGIGSQTKASDVYVEHYAMLHRSGFKLKGIVPASSNDKEFREEDERFGFEVRRLDQKIFSPQVSVEICGDAVKTIFHRKKEVVVIVDPSLADFYRQMFAVLWSQ